MSTNTLATIASRLVLPALGGIVIGLGGGSSWAGPPALGFSDVTEQMNLDITHDDCGAQSGVAFMSGGLAVGDVDRDGWSDVYVIGGVCGGAELFRNLGNGTFERVAQGLGVDLFEYTSGPTLADFNGDGWLDLLVGRTGDPAAPALFLGDGEGGFEAASVGHLPAMARSLSFGVGDYDLDGDLDLYVTRWDAGPLGEHLFSNDGSAMFTDVTTAAFGASADLLVRGFTPSFADINGDRWPDLLIASDFGNSAAFTNQTDGTFTPVTNVFVDENGMGGALADVDNDGDLDWFVSSIWDPAFPETTLGNRLYLNDGSGEFSDQTTTWGVADGGWGWGACFGDLDNDGDQDLVHTNGYRDPDFETDLLRVFLNQGTHFVESAVALGVVDDGQGRGAVCTDLNQDGRLEILVFNNGGPLRVFESSGPIGNWLSVRPTAEARAAAVGARVRVTLSGATQIAEWTAGSRYTSHGPVEAHFGFGTAVGAPTVVVLWPSGLDSVLEAGGLNREVRLAPQLIMSSGFESGGFGTWLTH